MHICLFLKSLSLLFEELSIILFDIFSRMLQENNLFSIRFKYKFGLV